MRGTRALFQKKNISHKQNFRGKLSFSYSEVLNAQLDPPKHILLNAPLNAQPRDVRRACMDVQAIDHRVNLSHIHAYPLGAPRSAALTTQYHITCPNAQAAKHAHHVLLSYPPFTQQQSRSWDDRDTEPFVTFTPYSAEEWAERLVERSMREASARHMRSMETARDDERSFRRLTPEWVTSSAGKRVLIRGLPAKIQPKEVAVLFSDFDVELPDVTKLPPTAWGNETSWAVQLDTVEEAHRAARLFNRNYYLDKAFGTRYPMRCHVAW